MSLQETDMCLGNERFDGIGVSCLMFEGNVVLVCKLESFCNAFQVRCDLRRGKFYARINHQGLKIFTTKTCTNFVPF